MEVYFYHLEHQTLDRVLPVLLERALEKGWRAVVEAGSQERLEALDTHLWTYSEDSFLPHATRKDASPDRQPVFLTTGEDNPNQAEVRFLVDGARLGGHDGYQRAVILFDGTDPEALARAREEWTHAKSKGHAVTYWQQGQSGKWERKA